MLKLNYSITFKLKNMIVITGASEGLGLQVAKLYKEEGKTVVNISRKESKYADVNICISLQEEKNIKEIVKKINEINEPLEALINCAGVMSLQKLEEVTESEIERVMSTNLNPAILLVSNLMGKIKKDETDIVNVASTVGHKGYVDQAVYGASKWAIRGFSKNLQEEFKGKPNRIISFCPGGFKSKIFEKATGFDNTGDGSEWMTAEGVAKALKGTLGLPNNMEVSEIVINRK